MTRRPARRRLGLIRRRELMGYSQADLANAVGVATFTISRWERAECDPQPTHRRKLMELLNLTPEQLDLLLTEIAEMDNEGQRSKADAIRRGAARSQHATAEGGDLATTTCSRQADEQEEVRQLLSHAANVTMGTAVHDVLRWRQPVEGQVAPVPVRVGMCDVAQIEAITAAMRALDYRYGGGACRDAVASQVRWAQHLLAATYDDHTGQRLHLALADLHNLAGWVSFDVGMYSTARKHFARALEQARYAGNMSLAANVLYRMGRLHLHRGMHHEALRFFQLGQITAQDSGSDLTVAMLCANEAWAYALLNDQPQMRRSISRAKDEFARADHTNPPAWVQFFGEADLHASIGVTLSSLPTASETDLAESIDQVTHAVALRGPDMARSQVFELTALATAYLRAGDRQHGLDAGRQAVAAATAVRSVRTLDRLGPLHAIASTYDGDGELRDLANQISTLRAAA